jgi:NAD(P)-dependent dehydrogenase (short-subunit alcohol dehydrogenase family)
MASVSWSNKSALVTGAASGIGLALAQALVARGAQVWLADIDEAGVRRAATELGLPAQAMVLDVRDAVAYQACVDQVVQAAGRLDFLFNNAGIGVAGEAHEMSAEHFDRILDINVRGTVHGVLAAYPQMVRQRSGTIVNTASAAGLIPSPLLTAYSMAKHAVVGLSASLRLEAAPHGVQVCVLCPSAIETPLLDHGNPTGLKELPWVPNVRRYLTRLGGTPYPVERMVEDALAGIARKQGQIVVPARARVSAWLYRMLPGLVQGEVAKALAEERGHRSQ